MTEGTRLLPSLPGSTRGTPFSTMATRLLVVPRSIPTIFGIKPSPPFISVGPTVRIAEVHRLRRPFHCRPVPPRPQSLKASGPPASPCRYTRAQFVPLARGLTYLADRHCQFVIAT